MANVIPLAKQLTDNQIPESQYTPILAKAFSGEDTQAAPVSEHLAHTLTTADGMGGPVFPAPPQVKLDPDPLHEIEGHEQNRLIRDYAKDATPWGSPTNHPGIGGKIAHALSHATGGDTRRQWEEDAIAKNLQGLISNESQNAERGAQTGHLEEETREMPGKTESEEGLQDAQTAEKQQALDMGPSLAAGYAHAVNQAIKEGRDPADDPIVQHLSGAIKSLQKEHRGVITDLKIGGHEHNVLVDPTSGKQIADLGLKGEKPSTVNVNTGEKAFEYSDKALSSLSAPISQMQMRMGRLKDTLAQGTPQADALAAPELLTIMAGGQGSGLRMNEAEIARIVGGRSHWENLRAAAQKWSTDPETANSITADQRQQIRALVQTVDAKLIQKQNILNEAGQNLLEAKTPEEQHKVIIEARRALTQVDSGSNESTQGGAPKAGDVVDGHRFKGGDAGKQENWEQVKK